MFFQVKDFMGLRTFRHRSERRNEALRPVDFKQARERDVQRLDCVLEWKGRSGLAYVLFQSYELKGKTSSDIVRSSVYKNLTPAFLEA